MPYTGQTRCGLEFPVMAGLPNPAISSNCSPCHVKGLVLTYVPASQFTSVRGEAALAEFHFNALKIGLKFCTDCGTQPPAEREGLQGPQRAINLRCVPEGELEHMQLNPANGASH